MFKLLYVFYLFYDNILMKNIKGKIMTLSKIEQYYNKFNEDKRLLSRHGQVEFATTINYINQFAEKIDNPKIIDIGAGTGRYSCYLAEKGYDVTAIELVKHNLSRLKQKDSRIKAYQGNALNLKKFEDNSFDITLLFGPMYHLFSTDDKIKALSEAKRITKPNGYIFVAYCMNEYSVITYAFKENNIKECIANNLLDENFKTITTEDNLYSYDRLENINFINEKCNLKRIKVLSPDGPTDYMRQSINKMDNETFEIYKKYILSICERQDLLGAGSHLLDILKK